MDELYLSKGKSNDFLIAPINPDGSVYEPDGTITKVVFGVKSGEFGTVLINKELTWSSALGGYLLSIDPDDTADLPEGLYSYDISYYTSGGGFYNMIESNRLYVKRSNSEYEEQGE